MMNCLQFVQKFNSLQPPSLIDHLLAGILVTFVAALPEISP